MHLVDFSIKPALLFHEVLEDGVVWNFGAVLPDFARGTYRNADSVVSELALTRAVDIGAVTTGGGGGGCNRLLALLTVFRVKC